MTFAEKAIAFNKSLHYSGDPLPEGINVMNPFKTSENALEISTKFYEKYYNDTNERYIIWGINPGRFGAGLTGIPFTDPKRLQSACNISYEGIMAHEPSSEFVYEVINAFGRCEKFYGRFYINSPSPLGYTFTGKNGKATNYNYYDDINLRRAVKKFMVESMTRLMDMGVRRDVCFCFGCGQNETCLSELNDEYKFFNKLVALEHPRYIMQYKRSSKQAYINKYLEQFARIDVPEI
jgi:hypothetical protein